jgi:glycogen operon protein
MMINAYWDELEFEVPLVKEFNGHDWNRWIDTSRESPDDICSWDEAVVVQEVAYPVQPRSMVVIVSRIKDQGKH